MNGSRIPCAHCGFYCEQPRTYPHNLRISFLMYLRLYVDQMIKGDKLETFIQTQKRRQRG